MQEGWSAKGSSISTREPLYLRPIWQAGPTRTKSHLMASRGRLARSPNIPRSSPPRRSSGQPTGQPNQEPGCLMRAQKGELAMGTPSDDYILGKTSAEYQRLRAQARLWEEATKRVLLKAGVHAGMSCLDIGCGPGEVMRLMGEIVGPEGCVTGVDVDGNIGREAVDMLRRTARGQYAFHEIDVESTDQVPGSPFDVT